MIEVLTVTLVITLAAGTPLAQTFNVPGLTMSQCLMLQDAPGVWWNLRQDVETKCKMEYKI